MKVFVSWSGTRSGAIALALRNWLPSVIDGMDIFHSEDIPKGRNWHTAIVAALRECRIGIFCVTPESLKSQWLLFEAGALAQHGDQPALFTYLYGLDAPTGPLSHFQATRFDRTDSLRFVRALAPLIGDADKDAVEARFEATWPSFEAAVIAGTLVPIQELLPGFPSLFDDEKTFNESFPDCSDKRWADRLRRTTRTHHYLAQREIEEVVSSDPYLQGAYGDLLAALDRYDMHIGSYLLQNVEYTDLGEQEQRRLEDARKYILDRVYALQQQSRPPVLRESLAFESERATDRRKAQIHELEGRLRRNELPMAALQAAGTSLNWALDRIVFYVAAGAGLLPDVPLKDLVLALKTEEERARSRNLVHGLQPLYYAAEAIDERLPAPLDAATNARLLEVCDAIEHFLGGHQGRDSGDHIRRRINSIRSKLTGS